MSWDTGDNVFGFVLACFRETINNVSRRDSITSTSPVSVEKGASDSARQVPPIITSNAASFSHPLFHGFGVDG